MDETNRLLACAGTSKIGREQLAAIAAPAATDTHKPIAHIDIVREIETALSFRHIGIRSEEFAVSGDGMRMFGLLTLDAEFAAGSFALGLRNANDKSMRLGMVAGYSVTVCSNMMFAGEFKPVLAKHSKNVDMQEVIALGVDRVHRNFSSIERNVDDWQSRLLDDRLAKSVILDAFTDKGLNLPASLLRAVTHHYFEPEYDEFRPRSMWSLSNAFTSGFKELKPVRQFQTTARLTPFLSKYAN